MKQPPLAAIFGCSGLTLTAAERAFFRRSNPLGFILFARNVADPDQVRALTAALRESVGREDAPILIDQEGGRVQRLRPPHWRAIPPAQAFGALMGKGVDIASEAVYLNHRLIAAELQDIGIDVDCTPLLDVPVPGAHDVIGDRAFGEDPGVIVELAEVACRGLLSGGVLPIVKHIPGHGRATVDSHHELPVVKASLQDLRARDFATFRRLNHAPIAMTAHVVYSAIDDTAPATTSRKVVAEIIRGEIGFDGVLLTDDLSMKALHGTFGERARDSLAAGCDILLHCNGDMAEMSEIAEAATPMDAEAQRRWARAQAMRKSPQKFDIAGEISRLEGLLS